MRERESLFNEFIIEVRKREKEEKIQKREQVRILDCFLLRNSILELTFFLRIRLWEFFHVPFHSFSMIESLRLQVCNFGLAGLHVVETAFRSSSALFSSAEAVILG